MKTLRKCEWEEIKIGEVFATTGCWEIQLKVSNKRSILLADDYSNYWCRGPLECSESEGYPVGDDIYKLPLKVQRLWRT